MEVCGGVWCGDMAAMELQCNAMEQLNATQHNCNTIRNATESHTSHRNTPTQHQHNTATQHQHTHIIIIISHPHNLNLEHHFTDLH
jgi:hypothetical protein